MSLLESLRPPKGSKKRPQRKGRGRGSRWGGTAGKGHKGQKARSGAPIKRGFEGGQTPLTRRIPKFGFTNARFKKTYKVFNLGDLAKLKQDVTLELLLKKKWVGKEDKVKILNRGKWEGSFKVEAHAFSKSSKKAIEKSGGKADQLK